MLYLDLNKSNTVNITVGELATIYTATQSIYNGPDLIGDLLNCAATGWVGTTHQFVGQTQAEVYDLDGHSPTSVASITRDGFLICLEPGQCYIKVDGSFCPDYLLTVNPNPGGITVETYALTQSFVWSIQDQDTKMTYTFSNDDTSVNQYYYNTFSFSVSLGATSGLTAGIIPAPSGNYIYNVYQTQYAGSLIPISNSLEVGLLTIRGTYSNPITNIIGDNDTIKVDKNID